VLDRGEPDFRTRSGSVRQVRKDGARSLRSPTGPDKGRLAAAQVEGQFGAGGIKGGLRALAGPVQAGGVGGKPFLRLKPGFPGGGGEGGGGVVVEVKHGG
jgi:hypothetical protein